MHMLPRAPWMLRGTPIADPRPSPMLGEHSFEVLSEELGVSPDEHEHLVAIGVTGERHRSNLPARHEEECYG